MHNSAPQWKRKAGRKKHLSSTPSPLSTLTPAWNKARHHILISNFRAFISPKCHPAGLVNYWQTDTNAKGHIKEAKSSGPGRACPLLSPSTGETNSLLMLLWELTVTLRDWSANIWLLTCSCTIQEERYSVPLWFCIKSTITRTHKAKLWIIWSDHEN